MKTTETTIRTLGLMSLVLLGFLALGCGGGFDDIDGPDGSCRHPLSGFVLSAGLGF